MFVPAIRGGGWLPFYTFCYDCHNGVDASLFSYEVSLCLSSCRRRSFLIIWFIRHIQRIKIFHFLKFDFSHTTISLHWADPFVTLFPALLLFWLAISPFLAFLSFFLWFEQSISYVFVLFFASQKLNYITRFLLTLQKKKQTMYWFCSSIIRTTHCS